MEGLLYDQSERAVRRREDPRIIHQLGEFDLATPNPGVPYSRGYDKGIVVKNFRVQMILGDQGKHPANYQIDGAIFESAARIRFRPRQNVEDDARKPAREPLDDCRHKTDSRGKAACYSDFARRRIGEEFDVLHGLPQLIEDGNSAIKQRASIDGEFDAAWRPIEEAHVQGVLQIGNRFCYDGVGNGKLPCGLGHVSTLHDCEKNMQVAQFEPPSYAIIPLHTTCLAEQLNRYSEIQLFS